MEQHQDFDLNRSIKTGERFLKEGAFTKIIIENSETFTLPPAQVTKGICEFLIKKNLIPVGDISKEVKTVLNFLQEFNKMTHGVNFYKSNAFKYIYEGQNLSEILQQILNNTTFWIERFGIDFFSRNENYSKVRNYIMKSSIDDDFHLSCKSGSGVGTFSVDFAIALNGGPEALPTQEIWRAGIDTQKTEEGTAMRIIRTGSAIKKESNAYAKKSEMYNQFKKRYGLTPQRALALLSMYIGCDLGVDEVKALSLEGARQKRLSLIRSSRVNFDYTQHFKSVGFTQTQNPNWLSIGNPQTGFYDAIKTAPDNLNGLRAYETCGMDRLIDTFQSLKSVPNENIKCPLSICTNETLEEIERVIQTFRSIHNKSS